MKKQILTLNQGGFGGDFSWLKKLEKIVVADLKIKKEISIALVNPVQIKELNRVYRGKDQSTDVLSFNIDSDQYLGEIIICPGIARDNAKQDNKSYVSELKLLTVHGILHLLGYDHEKNAKEKLRQEAMEKKILEKL